MQCRFPKPVGLFLSLEGEGEWKGSVALRGFLDTTKMRGIS